MCWNGATQRFGWFVVSHPILKVGGRLGHLRSMLVSGLGTLQNWSKSVKKSAFFARNGQKPMFFRGQVYHSDNRATICFRR
jgi:hypothetical protein